MENMDHIVPTNEYKPMGAWAYFGYDILFSIPFIGFILMLVFAFDNSYIARRNFARSFFCVYVIFAIIALIVFAAGASLLPLLQQYFSNFGF